MRLNKRSDGMWLVAYIDEDGVRRRVSCRTRDPEDAIRTAKRIARRDFLIPREGRSPVIIDPAKPGPDDCLTIVVPRHRR